MFRPRYAEIAFQFLVDVHQRRRRADARLNAEAQAMGLPLAMVGVLPEDHDAHVIERGQIQRAEPLARSGKDAAACGAFSNEECAKRLHSGARKVARKMCLPAFVQLDGIRHGVGACDVVARESIKCASCDGGPSKA